MKQQMEGMEKLKEEIMKMKIQNKHIDYHEKVELSKSNKLIEMAKIFFSENKEEIKKGVIFIYFWIVIALWNKYPISNEQQRVNRA